GSAASASNSATHAAKPFHVTPRVNRSAPTLHLSAALTHPVASGLMKAHGLRPTRTGSGSTGSGSKGAPSVARATGLGTAVAKDPLLQANGFEGTAQAQAVYDFGANQEVAPPDGGDVAAGPSDIGEVTNSAIYFYRRNGVEDTSFDLSCNATDSCNGFLAPDLPSGWFVSDPRLIWDQSSGHWFFAELEYNPTPGGACSSSNDSYIAL